MNEQQNNPKNKIAKLATFDSIAEYAINALTEKSPSYFSKYEKKLADETLNYTNRLIKMCENGTLSGKSPDVVMENLCDGILYASCVSNKEHFKIGLEFGALLIMQLLF